MQMKKSGKVEVYILTCSIVKIIIICTRVVLELTCCVFWPVNSRLLAGAIYLLGVSWIHLLSEFVELVQVLSRNGLSSAREGFFEMSASNHWNGVVNFLHVHVDSLISVESASLFFSLDSVTNSRLASALAKLCDISTTKVLS
jgi:predicted tellurium resistance membrane protein TerC